MDSIIIGNIIMFIGSIVMVLAGFAKTKQGSLIMQTVQIVIMTVGTLFLGSITGAIMNGFSIGRNILDYNGRLDTKMKVMLIMSSTIIGFTFNNIGWVGILPISVFVLYTLCMSTKDVVKFKILTIVGCVLFFINDLCIQSYTSLAFDIFTIAANIYAIVSVKNKKIVAA